MLSQHYYLANAHVSSRLDGCWSRRSSSACSSLEYAETTLIGEETLQLVRHCAQLLGHWQPEPRSGRGASPSPLPGGLSCKTGNGYCRALARWAMTSERRLHRLAREFQSCAAGSLAYPALYAGSERPSLRSGFPCGMEIGLGGRSSSTGQSLYGRPAAALSPAASQLLALNAKATSAFRCRGRAVLPRPDRPSCWTGRWTIPMSPCSTPSNAEQRERTAIGLQRLANDDALRLAEVAFNTLRRSAG